MRFDKPVTFFLMWSLCLPMVLYAEEVAQAQLSPEFLFYLLEFQDDDGDWVDPQALQLMLEDSTEQPGAQDRADDPQREVKP